MRDLGSLWPPAYVCAAASNDTSRRVVGQWGGAGGASCEDHLAFCGELLGDGFDSACKTRFFNSKKKRRRDCALRTTPSPHLG